MVRSSLDINNRICFDSDRGGAPDRSNPAEMAQREARARASVGFGTQTRGGPAYSTDAEKQAFANRVDRGDFAATQERERQAAQRQADERAADARARRDAQQDVLNRVTGAAQQSLSTRPASSTRTTGEDSSFFSDAYQDLYGQRPRGTALATVLQAGPFSRILGSVLGTPSPQEIAARDAGRMFSVARRGMSPEEEARLISGENPMFDANTGTFRDVPVGNTGGTLSTGFLGGPVYTGMNDPDYSGPFENIVRGFNPTDRDGGADDRVTQQGNIFDGSTPSESIATGGDIPSSELAVNFLENPFFAYSGFGNQFFPYGYATGTLVDLLQTRGMTQPNQADTLGLFGNPTDFS